MPRPDIVTATVVETCPNCGTTTPMLARTDRDRVPVIERRLAYCCGARWCRWPQQD